MDVKRKYLAVVKELEAKNYDAALKLLYKMRAKEKDFYYLEAAIFHGLNNYLKEYRTLKKLLPLLPRSSPEDKEIYDGFSTNLGVCCSKLSLIDESLKWYCHAINNTKYKNFFCEAISNTCFIMGTKEDTSAADFQALYDKFRSFFTFEPYPKKFYGHDKIRVGFLSADFHNHVVIKWSCRLVTDLDKNLFETYCYSNTNKMTRLISFCVQASKAGETFTT